MIDKQRAALKRLLDSGRISLEEYDLMLHRVERPSDFEFYMKASVTILILFLSVVLAVTLADWFSNLL